MYYYHKAERLSMKEKKKRGVMSKTDGARRPGQPTFCVIRGGPSINPRSFSRV